MQEELTTMSMARLGRPGLDRSGGKRRRMTKDVLGEDGGYGECSGRPDSICCSGKMKSRVAVLWTYPRALGSMFAAATVLMCAVTV